MRESVVVFVNWAIEVLVLLVLVLLPIFALNSSVSVLGYPKVFLLAALVLVLVLLWGVKAFFRRRFSFTQTVFDLPLLLLLIATLLSVWFSVDPVGSLIGEWGVWHWSLVSLLGSIGLYYLIVSNFHQASQVQRALAALLAGGAVVALTAVVGYVLDFGTVGSAQSLTSFLASINYNLVGGARSLILFALALLPFAVRGLLQAYARRQWPGVALHALYSIIFVAAVVLWLAPFLPGVEARVPTGPSLGLRDSWVASLSALRDHPFFGSGPGTFFSNFTQYRSLSLNASEKWGLRFVKPVNEYFEILATLGLLGVAAFLLLIWRVLRLVMRPEGVSAVYPLATVMILVGWLGVASNLVTAFLFFVVLALWMVEEKIQQTGVTEEKILGFVAARVFLVLAAVLLLGGGFVLVQDFRSNLAFARALRLIGQNASGREIYRAQQQALQLNPYRDVYRRAYSQTNLALAQAVMANRQGQPTQQEQEDVLALTRQAIREARLITEQLGPMDVRNWEVRGQVYESLVGQVEGAEDWAIQAYQRAISLDPTNPNLRVQLGGIYLRQQRYDLAEQSFRQAVQLKPDLANAHFNLAVTLREKDEIEAAKQEFLLTERLLDESASELDRRRLEEEKSKLEVQPDESSTP